jgi:hypothetical protein
MASYHPPAETAELAGTLKRGAAALREADVPFALAGSVAAWARGGPSPCNDVDFVIRADDAVRAEEALGVAGMRTEHPPEGWLLKAWDGNVVIDLIWELEGCEDADDVLARAEVLSVQAVRMPVMDVDDLMTSKLCSFDEHALDFTGALAIARALREQVDWRGVRQRTGHSPYARGFLALLEALEVIAAPGVPARQPDRPRVRVVPGG